MASVLALAGAAPGWAQPVRPADASALRRSPAKAVPRVTEPAVPVVQRPLGRTPDPSLQSPGLAGPVAPRLDSRAVPPAGGGSQCRTRCAGELYRCEGAADGGGCFDVWSRCVQACPAASGGSF